MYLEPELSGVKQDSELNELHLIEKGYKKFANSISKVLKYPKKTSITIQT